MKFRKSASSSPKMELLSRRSSGGRMSTLKRSRSFRASVKLMSKIRNHANLRLTAGLDFSSVSKDPKKERKLPVLEESQDGEKPSSPQKIVEDTNSRAKDPRVKMDGERLPASPSPRKISASNLDVGPREITKDLKNKLSLTDRLMGKGRKDVERPSTKDEGMKSPKVIHIFRRRHSMESPREDTREKDCSDKRASGETDTGRPSKHVFYENPTFVLDNSLDSSVSSFLFEVEEEEEEEKEQQREQDGENNRAVSSKRDVLTVVVDSHKAATNRPFYRKTSYERDKDEDEEYLENGESRNAFRPRCETDPLSRPCEARRDHLNINGNRRTTESFGEFDRPRIKLYCKLHETERKNATICLQNQKMHDGVKTCPSKSCKIRTVDNIANFWASRRGNSFRNKMTTGRKRDAKEAKDYERLGQERVFASTSSGSSTLDQ